MSINPKYLVTNIVIFGWIPIFSIGREIRLFDVIIGVSLFIYFNKFKKILTKRFILFLSFFLVQAFYSSIEWDVDIVYYFRFFELVIFTKLLMMLDLKSLHTAMVRFFVTLFLLYVGIKFFGLQKPFFPDIQSVAQSIIILSTVFYFSDSSSILSSRNTLLIMSIFLLISWTAKSYMAIGVILYFMMLIRDLYLRNSLKNVNLKSVLQTMLGVTGFIIIGFTSIPDKTIERLEGAIPIIIILYDVSSQQSMLSDNPLKNNDEVNLHDYTTSYIDESFSRKSARYVLLIQQLFRFPDNLTGIGLGGSNLRASESFILVLLVELGLLLTVYILVNNVRKQFIFFAMILMFGTFNSLWYTEVTIVLCMLWVVNNANYYKKLQERRVESLYANSVNLIKSV